MYPLSSLLHRLFALLLGLTAVAVTPSGQTAVSVVPPDQTADPTVEDPAVNSEQREVADQLRQTAAAIEAKQEQVKVLTERLKTSSDAEKAEVETQIVAAEKSLDASRDHFAALAVGGVNLGADEGEMNLDWQTELLEIAKPVVSSLKALTKKPRIMDRLRTQIELREDNLLLIDKALASLKRTAASDLQPEVAARVAALEEEWQNHRETAVQDLDMLRFQLAQLQGETSSMLGNLDESVGEFLAGRGRTLATALSATFLTWWLMRLLARTVFHTRDPEATRLQAPGRRIGLLVFRLATGLLMLFVVILVLYVSGDWFLLGLALLALIGAAISLRTTLPRYLNEARLFLNMGPVRQGERVIYAGLPWRVRSLNVYSTLFNPDLQGGVLRLPSSEIAKLTSRPDHKEESWFPTRTDDVVLLEGDVMAKVLLQTPEVVRLRYRGAVREVPTASFVGMAMHNLSRDGFVALVTFGIDYAHQDICVDQIAPIFQEAVEARLRADYGDQLVSVTATFKEAAISSLDYLIVATMQPSAAADYFAIKRAVQQECVTVCNVQGWGIPFPQLVLHAGEGLSVPGVTQGSPVI